MTWAIFPGELLGFDEQVDVLGTAEAVLLQVIAFERVQDFQRGQALSVRRQLVNVVAAIIRLDGLDPFALVRGHVFV